jgi:hypothetical protein
MFRRNEFEDVAGARSLGQLEAFAGRPSERVAQLAGCLAAQNYRVLAVNAQNSGVFIVTSAWDVRRRAGPIRADAQPPCGPRS